MRLEKYITEDRAITLANITKTDEWKVLPPKLRTRQALDLFSNVKKDCTFATQLVRKTGKLFFRGMGTRDIYGVNDVRQDRKPKDTKLPLHNQFNEILEDLFGWKPRSQGLFVTTDFDQTSDYGKEYIVFPVGKKWDYVWAWEAADALDKLSYARVRNIFLNKYDHLISKHKGNTYTLGKKMVEDGLEGKSEFDWVNKGIRDIIEKIIIDDMDYTDKDIKDAMLLGNEIMIRTPRYYYFNTSYNHVLRRLVGI